MEKFQSDFSGANRTAQLDAGRGKSRWHAVPIFVIAWISFFTAQAQGPRIPGFQPSPPSNQFVNNEDAHPVGTLELKAKGLRPNTAFRVFLAKDFIGEIATNADGRGSMHPASIVEGRSSDTNRLPAVLRFANPSEDDVCFTPLHEEDDFPALNRRDLPYRRTASATTTSITDAPSMNGDDSILHTINWRSTQCVSTF
jgi:hypothetical protein